ncbi:hypothetical protein BaRGS_00015308 [Batillaria attramentaria]|uniref:Uncharacterized protein n=1 Tax=Batillaria attramentaria TaxID=370345 RepID=A0ABD0L261_9CAEN
MRIAAVDNFIRIKANKGDSCAAANGPVFASLSHLQERTSKVCTAYVPYCPWVAYLYQPAAATAGGNCTASKT